MKRQLMRRLLLVGLVGLIALFGSDIGGMSQSRRSAAVRAKVEQFLRTKTSTDTAAQVVLARQAAGEWSERLKQAQGDLAQPAQPTQPFTLKPLVLGQAESGQVNPGWHNVQYTIAVSSEQARFRLTIRLESSTGGDIDLFVRADEPVEPLGPRRTRRDFSSESPGPRERLTIDARSCPVLRPATYYIAILNYEGSPQSFTLVAELGTEPISSPYGIMTVNSGQTVEGHVGGSPDSPLITVLSKPQYAIDVPEGALSLEVTLLGQSNLDLELGVNYGGPVCLFWLDEDFNIMRAHYWSVLHNLERQTLPGKLVITRGADRPLQAGRYFIAVGNDEEEPQRFLVRADVRTSATSAFAESEKLSTEAFAPGPTATADVNGDGRPDVIVANSGSNELSVLLNQGAGHFERRNIPLDIFPAGGYNPQALTTAEITGDGNLDLIVANQGRITVLLGNGSGNLVVRNSLDVALECPKFVMIRVFILRIDLPVEVCPQLIAAGDFTGDGLTDLVVPDVLGSVWLFTGDGRGGFVAPREIGPRNGVRVLALAPGDFNKDGKLDLFASGIGFLKGNDLPTIWLLLGDGAGGFTVRDEEEIVDGSIQDIFNQLQITDFDGDGHLDAVTFSYEDRSLSVFRGNGQGRFSYEWKLELAAIPAALTASGGELAVGLETGRALGLTKLDGLEFRVGWRLDAGTTAQVRGLATADFDSDGDLDAAVVDRRGSEVSIYLRQ